MLTLMSTEKSTYSHLRNPEHSKKKFLDIKARLPDKD